MTNPPDNDDVLADLRDDHGFISDDEHRRAEEMTDDAELAIFEIEMTEPDKSD
jgi:hypothetical protein